MFELIQELCDLSGPVGQEAIVQDRIQAHWQALGATVSRTRINNVIAHLGGKGPKVLLAAHADELTFLVRAIHPDGFLWLANGQAWMRSVGNRNAFTIGQRVRVMSRSGEIPGVIATAAGHLASFALPELQELTWNDFWVDTGLSRDELSAQGVTPGTRVIWEARIVQWGKHIVGKALDDRVPLAVLTEVARRTPKDRLACDLTLVSTVQEEIGLVGASAFAARHQFDAAISVEIGLAADIPSVPEHAMPVRLGSGPILVHKDALVHYDYDLTARLETVAKESNIPIQHAVFGSFGSDSSAFMKADIPAALVAFPARYTHTPFETGHIDDIEALVEWLSAFVQRG